MAGCDAGREYGDLVCREGEDERGMGGASGEGGTEDQGGEDL